MKTVRIFGIPTEVRAEIDSLDELSGHGDSDELIEWMRPMTPGLKRVFLVHGEPEQSSALAARIQGRYGIDTVPVSPEQSYDL
jgi:metallo-beta-lactamase family protein